MLDEKLHSYIESLIPPRHDLFADMEVFAKEHQVPIMEPAGIEALLMLLRIQRPSAILELGTAIGYSALRMAEAVPEAKIVTIERDEERYHQALSNFNSYGAKARIVPLFGDALELAGSAEEHGPYDAIFIDAAKGQYRKFFDLYSPMLKTGGLVITDNVLFKGRVYGTDPENKRLAKLAEKIHSYNKWLAANEEYDTTILPIGDGVAISYKKG